MDRRDWTEADERITYRRWVGYRYDLDEPEVLPFHLRDASRDHWRAQDARPRRRAKHAASDGEEPSRVVVSIRVPSVVVLAGVVGFVIAGAWLLRRL